MNTFQPHSIFIPLISLRYRNAEEEEVEKVYESERTEDTRRTRSFQSTEQSSDELTETERAYTGPAQVCTRFSMYVF